MGRPRKPTNILKLNGAFKHDPARGKARENEPVPTGGIGSCPDHISELTPIWDEVVDIVPPGVLSNCDRIIMEMICRSIHQLRTDTISDGRFSRLAAMLGKIGLTPSDRSKIIVPKQYSTNPFDQL